MECQCRIQLFFLPLPRQGAAAAAPPTMDPNCRLRVPLPPPRTLARPHQGPTGAGKKTSPPAAASAALPQCRPQRRLQRPPSSVTRLYGGRLAHRQGGCALPPLPPSQAGPLPRAPLMRGGGARRQSARTPRHRLCPHRSAGASRSRRRLRWAAPAAGGGSLPCRFARAAGPAVWGGGDAAPVAAATPRSNGGAVRTTSVQPSRLG